MLDTRKKGIEMEADQRLIEGIITGMGVKDCNPASSPGTKSKPISKEAHKDIMSRRLAGLEESNEKIAHQAPTAWYMVKLQTPLFCKKK